MQVPTELRKVGKRETGGNWPNEKWVNEKRGSNRSWPMKKNKQRLCWSEKKKG